MDRINGYKYKRLRGEHSVLFDSTCSLAYTSLSVTPKRRMDDIYTCIDKKTRSNEPVVSLAIRNRIDYLSSER